MHLLSQVFLLFLLFFVADSCTFTQRSIKTKNSSPALLEDDVPVYICKPKSGQDEAVLVLEFEHVYEDNQSRALLEHWPVNKLRLDCDSQSEQLFTTALEGHRKYLLRSWCSGYRKKAGVDRKSIVEEIKEQIGKEHTEL